MKKTLIVILVIALLVPLLSITVFAADDLDNNGIAGMLRSIWTFLASAFNNVINSILKVASFIGSGIEKIIKAIGDALLFLVDAIKRLFIPGRYFFQNVQKRLQTAINIKIGGILSLTEYLKSWFSGFSNPANVDNMFIVEFPKSHLFGGYRIDLLSYARNHIPLFRNLLSGLMFLMTSAFAYKRVRSMINT